MRLRARSILLTIAIAANGLLASAQEPTFTPVTEAMLLDPDPADWLSWRRTLDGWGYSPLDQINTQNADQTAPRMVVGSQLRGTTRAEPAGL